MGKHILLAEDDIDDQQFFSAALKEVSESAHLTIVSSAEAAFEFLQASEALPDICVLDINMPGATGMELLKTLREQERFNALPIVMLTTSSERQSANQSFELGANGYYSKPSTHNMLKEIVSKILNSDPSRVPE